MPKASSRGLAMPASPIRRLMPYAEAAVARGTKVLHLNIGQPDIESPDSFWDAIRSTDIKVLEYSHAAGQTPLRQEMAKFYTSIGIGVDVDNVIVTTAGSEALQFAMTACLEAGDEVIVPEPLYANYLGFARPVDVNVVPITTRIEDDFALPPISEFEKRVTPRTKAILINNPSNPTGAVYTSEQLEGLRRLVIERDLFLISDEVYRDFNFTDEPIQSVLQLEGLERHAVMVDSVSKRFSLCGARIGFLVSRSDEFNAVVLRLAQARLSSPSLEQIAVLNAIRNTPQEFLDDVRTEYMSRRDLLVSRLKNIPGIVVPRIDGAFYATVRLPIDDSDRFCQWLLESFTHQGHTVMFAPATGFYETAGLGRDEVRIAYVLGRERLSLAMDCLEAALAAYPGTLLSTSA